MKMPGAMRAYGGAAVITGASSGIGAAFARHLAAAGVPLVLCARNESALRALAGELHARHAVACEVVVADLATEHGIRTLEAATSASDAGLLVAAAGFGTSGRILAADRATEREMLEVNCWATFALAQTFAARFAERGRGGIVLFASLVGRQGTPFAAHYAATKAYVQTLAEGLRVELAPRGVDVVACAPGPVTSGFAERAKMTLSMTDRPEDLPAATLRALGKRDVAVPGRTGRLLTLGLAPLPRSLRVRIMGKIMDSMTRRS